MLAFPLEPSASFPPALSPLLPTRLLARSVLALPVDHCLPVQSPASAHGLSQSLPCYRTPRSSSCCAPQGQCHRSLVRRSPHCAATPAPASSHLSPRTNSRRSH